MTGGGAVPIGVGLATQRVDLPALAVLAAHEGGRGRVVETQLGRVPHQAPPGDALGDRAEHDDFRERAGDVERGTGLAAGENGAIRHSLECLVFLVLVSAPLSAILIVMLRRGYALRPGLVAVMGGLAAAAAAALLLNFFHPFDAVATDLLVHTLAVGLILGINWAFGGRILNARR